MCLEQCQEYGGHHATRPISDASRSDARDRTSAASRWLRDAVLILYVVRLRTCCRLRRRCARVGRDTVYACVGASEALQAGVLQA